MAADSPALTDRDDRLYRGMRSARDAFEEAPARESMRGPRSLQKEWGALLIKLRRVLLKNVGRPWDDVYREVCAMVGATHPLRKLLDQRLSDLVATDVVEQRGKLMRNGPAGQGLLPLADFSSPEGLLYVSPTTRKLARVVPDDAQNRIVLSEWELVRRVGKHWYRLALAPLVGREAAPSLCFDVVLRRVVSDRTASLKGKLVQLYGREGVFALSKRQVGKAELERLR